MKRAISLLCTALLLLALCACGAPADGAITATVSVTPVEGDVQFLFVNAGKADATILSAGGRHYLVDTGEKTSVPAILGALRLLGIETLDGVFLTHTHSDHTGGMELLAENIAIQMLYHASITELTDKGVNKFERFSEELSIPHTALNAGDTFPLAEGVTAEVLAPLVPNDEDDNDQSLVLMVTANGRTVLLTGDMQFAEEQSLLDAGASLKADVLKVGNHGNPDATSDTFAAAVSPSVAVIPTDTDEDNDSANPRVIAALDGADIHITEAYSIGVCITISTDGTITAGEPSAAPLSSVTIQSIRKQDQTATLQNSGPGADLSGYMLFSEKGKELLVLPAGTVISAGGTITVACEGGSGDVIWTGETEVWNPDKEDTGILYDALGRELSRMDSE